MMMMMTDQRLVSSTTMAMYQGTIEAEEVGVSSYHNQQPQDRPSQHLSVEVVNRKQRKIF
jgi:hypothetical protein